MAMAAVPAEVALDISEGQVCINYDDDPNYTWHHRVLLSKLDAGRWVVLTPDGDVEVVDLSAHRVVPLLRGAPVPARVAGDVYLIALISDEELRRALAEASALAAILGVTTVAVSAGVRADWIFSDPAHENWGVNVPAALLSAIGQTVLRGSTGLVQEDPVDATSWTTMERILPADLEAWKDEKRSGPRRDPRVLPPRRDAQGHRYSTLRQAMLEMTMASSSAASSTSSTAASMVARMGSDWIFRGPSAVSELLRGVRASGEDLSGYHEYYCRASGLEPANAVAIKHRDLLSILHHMVTFDQLDAPFLASAELCARLILQCQAAVKKSPKQPDFRGLQMMVQSDLDSGGGVLTGDFARFVAEEQKTEAFTLKQQRLYADETTQSQKRSGGK
jgi:hypothetical protein